MKRWIYAAAFVWASSLWAAQPAPLTILRQIHALSNTEANKGIPVAFDATVTFFRSNERLLFVQDDDIASYVLIGPKANLLLPGDRVQIQGKTSGSFNPIVISDHITLLHHGTLPRAVPATFQQLVNTQFDCRLVSVRGVVRSANVMMGGNLVPDTDIQLLTEAGHVEVNLNMVDVGAIDNLLDATVEVTGVSAGKFDDKMQLTGTVLYGSSSANIRVLAPPIRSPWLATVTPLDKILSVYNVRDLTPRVRVQGTVTYFQPGLAVVLQDGSKSLWIETNSIEPLRIGNRVEAIGFTEERDRFLSMIDAEIKDSQVFAPIAPQLATWQQLSHWSTNQPDGHQNDLVTIEGTVATEVREDAQDEYVLDSDGRLFTAIYHHPSVTGSIPPMRMIPLGSRVRVTGICTRTDTRSADVGREVPFNILMRSFDDIAVIATPSLVNIRNLIFLASALFVLVFIAGIRSWIFERRVRRHTAASATLEQHRSSILEDINGSRPLAEILEEITEMISFILHGAPCWCELANGSQLGEVPPELECLRLIQEEIPARSGSALGKLYAAFQPSVPAQSEEKEALLVGTRLATLAIETRKLNADLRRRSEYDLLTDIPNRFAMEKFIEEKIEEAAKTGGKLGLIYIDLDKFKPINDTYGHHVGDLFLQAVARRMCRQLLGSDLLARLGGDEFAALVQLPHGVSDLKTIVARLDQCFLDPFVIEEHAIHGAASIGYALYPQDGVTQDELLKAADAAMYATKNVRK